MNNSPILPPIKRHFDFSALPDFQVRETFARIESGARVIYAGGQNGKWSADEIVWDERGGHWATGVSEPRDDKYQDAADALAAVRASQGLRAVVAGLTLVGASVETYQGEPLLRVASGATIAPIAATANPYATTDDYLARYITQERLFDADGPDEIIPVNGIFSAPDGSYILWANAGAEWSAVRVRVGAGTWVRDGAIYPGPGCPLFTKLAGYEEILMSPSDIFLHSVAFDELARAVTCSCVTHTAIRTLDGQFDVPAGSQLIAGLRASRNGPQTALWLLHEDGTARLLAASPTFSDGRCECAKTNHHASDIGQAPDGRLFILSECNLAIYNPDGATPWNRLQPFPESVDGHPGGQTLRFPGADNAALAPTPQSESQLVFFTENFGGVSESEAWYNRLVRRVNGIDYSGPSTLWHGPDCAEIFRGDLWAVRGEKSIVTGTPTPTPPPTVTLFLDTIVDGKWSGNEGLKRTTIARDGDAATGTIEKWQRLRRAGKNLWCFGWRLNPGAVLGEESAICYVTRGLTIDEAQLPYFVRRATPDDGAGSLLLCARAQTDGIGAANRVIEIEGASGGGGTRVCSFWNGEAGEFRMSQSAFENAGGDVAKLPAFYAWSPQIGANGGGVWLASTTQPVAPYLATTLTGDVIAFALSGTLPYDANQWDELCFEIRADGSVVGPNIETTCGSAQCVLDKMPIGTRFRVIALQVPTGATALSSYQITDASAKDGSGYGRLQRARGVYPSLWSRIDSAAAINDLTSYTQLANYGREIELERDARARVDVIVLVTPGNIPLSADEMHGLRRLT